MKLYTERKENDYKRIVDIYIDKSENDLAYINDSTTCKLVIIKKGSVSYGINGKSSDRVNAPAAVFLSNTDSFLISHSKFKATTVYFKPSLINDIFTYDRIEAGEFEDKHNTTIYQDYLIIRNFLKKDGYPIKTMILSDDSLLGITYLIDQMETELSEQYDGYWPCRSRSFFIELLFQINFCYTNNPYTLETKNPLTSQVIEYLNRHIGDKLTLEILTKEFHINRNILNQMFLKDTGMTCLNYLLSLRIDLAKLWLKETEIPINEIAQRLGYFDNNYFAKVFKKSIGCSPTEYRYM